MDKEAKQEIISANTSHTDTERETAEKRVANLITVANDIGIQKDGTSESKKTIYQANNEKITSSFLEEKESVIEENSDSESHGGSDPNSMTLADDGKVTDTAKRIAFNQADSAEYINEISDEDLFNQGRKFYLGDGIAIDIPMAVELFTKSAELGNEKASYVLYKIYYHDQASKELAIQYLKKAADLNYIPAMYDLAIHLLYGDDIGKNITRAIQLLDKCAEKGNQPAISKLFYLYRVGLGKKADRNKAQYYRKMLRE